MTKQAVLLFGITAVSMLAGCASSPVKPSKAALPQVPAQALITPAVKTFPVQAPQPSPSYTLTSEAPQPIWNPTVIGKVELDAYVDEKGRLFAPSTMYVIRKKGGWNVDAVRGNAGYVPPENSAKPYNMPGMEWGTSAVVENPQNQPTPVDLDVSKAKLTGLVDKSAEQAARAMAGRGEIAVYDQRFGWVIVRQADIAAGFSIEKPKQPSEYQQMRSVEQNTNQLDDTTPKTPAPAQTGETKGPVFNDL
jgi:hypothetical protein